MHIFWWRGQVISLFLPKRTFYINYLPKLITNTIIVCIIHAVKCSSVVTDTHDMKTLSELLKTFDFSIAEIAIYKHLLKSGPQTIVEISKFITTPRSTIYDSCQRMVHQGLLSKIEGYKTTKYEISTLDNIKRNIEKAKLDVKTKEQDFNELKELLETTTRNVSDVNIKFYEGESGIEQILYNTLYAKTEIYGYSTYGRREFINMNFYNDYERNFKERGLKEKVLTNNATKTLKYIKKHFLPAYLKDVRYLEINDICIGGDTSIYNNVYSTISWTKGKITGIEITSEEFVKLQKDIFKILWKRAKPILDII